MAQYKFSLFVASFSLLWSQICRGGSDDNNDDVSDDDDCVDGDYDFDIVDGWKSDNYFNNDDDYDNGQTKHWLLIFWKLP